MFRAIFSAIFPAQAKAETAVATALNVKSNLVGEMIAAMGPERGNLFLDHLKYHDFKEVDDAAFTFYIYRIYVKNQHPNEIRWWRDRMIEKGFDTTLSKERIDIVSMYLKHAGVDSEELRAFAAQYNSAYSTPSG